jgi:DNA-binding NarL/FixJ family response regulator
MDPIKIVIIDDHRVVVDGLKGMLAKFPHIQIELATQDAGELMDYLAQHSVDVLLMDIQMPGVNGVELCKQIHRLAIPVAVMAFTSFDDSSYVKQLFRSGAKGYLLKNADADTIVQAIEILAAGGEFMDEMIKKILLQESISGQRRSIFEIPLTKREKEIVQLIADGLSNQEIADRLFIALRTVETHRLNINQKLGVKNSAGVIKEGIKRGLID